MNRNTLNLSSLLSGNFSTQGHMGGTPTPFLSFKFSLNKEIEIPLVAASKVYESYTNEYDEPRLGPDEEYIFNYCIPPRYGNIYSSHSIDNLLFNTLNSTATKCAYTSNTNPLVPHRYKGFRGILLDNDDRLLILVTFISKWMTDDCEPIITGYKIYIDKSITSGKAHEDLSKYIIKKFIPYINSMIIRPNVIRGYNYLDKRLSEIPITIVIEDLQQYIHTCQDSNSIDLDMIPSFNIEAIMDILV